MSDELLDKFIKKNKKTIRCEPSGKSYSEIMRMNDFENFIRLFKNK